MSDSKVFIPLAVLAALVVATTAGIAAALAVPVSVVFAAVFIAVIGVGYLLLKTVTKPVKITVETARRNAMMASMRNKAFQERNYDDA